MPHAGQSSERLMELHSQYRSELPGRIARALDLWNGLSGGAEVDEGHERLRNVRRVVHNLAEASAVLDLPAVARIAAPADALLQAVLREPHRPQAERLAQVEAFMKRLAVLVDDGTADPSRSDGPFCLLPIQPNHVVLVDFDHAAAGTLATQIRSFGYHVRVCHEPEEVPHAVAETQPSVILADLDAAERVDREAWGEERSLIVLSAHDDFGSRLAAVRAGARFFFVKPVEPVDLIGRIDRCAMRQGHDPLRVLIVEDDPALARCHALVLQGGGMATSVVTQPEQMIEALTEAAPEVMLIDLDMPDWPGVDLARVVEQHGARLGMATVFYGADSTRRHGARLHGGESLPTPLDPIDIATIVRNRAERVRDLRRLMSHDSLTGLLNHTRLKERLGTEILTAQRTRRPVSFMMLDIDHFKKVNDRYGHMVGDRVLKAVARLLQQRLRRSDVVGRYGGEEFAAILPATEIGMAVRLADEIRSTLGGMVQRSNDGEFSVTLSCGVAGWPGFETLDELIEAADQALYRAKRSGRNRTEVVNGGAAGGKEAS